MDEREIQEILAENGYQCIQLLGKGGFGQCYKVFSEKYKEFFACKVFFNDPASDKHETSFLNEADMLSHISHKHVVPVFQTLSTKKYQFMILEYCPNGDLQNEVQKNGPIPKEKLLTYLSQILEALIFIYSKNIAHNDIKPANILLDQYGRARIADFGLGKRVENHNKSRDFTGSFVFLPPEVLQHKPYDPLLVDRWSFGITVFFLATGTFPYPIDDFKLFKTTVVNGDLIIPPNLDPLIYKIVKGATQIEPSQRMTFQEMYEIINKEGKEKVMVVKRLPPLVNRNSARAIAAKATLLKQNKQFSRISLKRTESFSLIET